MKGVRLDVGLVDMTLCYNAVTALFTCASRAVLLKPEQSLRRTASLETRLGEAVDFFQNERY